MADKKRKAGGDGEAAGQKRCVLAFSGGLDTSCILAWLIEKGYEVVCYLADIGQVHDDVNQIRDKALKIGAKKCYVEDLRKEFVTDFVFPLLRSGALYEGRYLMGTSVARPLIAKRQVEIAHMENCKFLAHGATGKGNDQVRFELTANALDPTLVTIAPWRDPEFLARFQGRQDLLDFAAAKHIQVEQTKKDPWSIDENLLHTSYESGILEDPALAPPARMFKVRQRARAVRWHFGDVLARSLSPQGTADPLTVNEAPERIRIEFHKGDPVKVVNLTNAHEEKEPLALFTYLNRLGCKHGVGRIDMVENRFVGIKSRGVYETPGGTIIFKAHQDLEGVTVDREVLALRNSLSATFARLCYNGFWYSPEMDFVRHCLDKSQELVDGSVTLTLGRGHVVIEGRESPFSRYSKTLASMDVAGEYNPTDAAGFIRINGLRLKVDYQLQELVRRADPKRAKTPVVPPAAAAAAAAGGQH